MSRDRLLATGGLGARCVRTVRLGAVRDQRAHLGLLVPLHRDRARLVRAGSRRLRPDRVRRTRALVGAGHTAHAHRSGGSRSDRPARRLLDGVPAHDVLHRRAVDRLVARGDAGGRDADLDCARRNRAAPPCARGLLVCGLAVGFVGVLVLSWPSVRDADATAVGVLLVVLATVSYGIAGNATVPLQQRYGALPALARRQLVALVLTLPYALAGIARVVVLRPARWRRSRCSASWERGWRSWPGAR